MLWIMIRDKMHCVDEFQPTSTVTLTHIADLQEDSVGAFSGHHKVPIGVADTSMTEGISFITFPLKVSLRHNVIGG